MKQLVFLYGIVLAFDLSVARGATAEAQYSLPFHPDYSEFLNYDLNVRAWSDVGNTIAFRYVLPEDLVGRSNYEMTMFGDYSGDDEFFEIFCSRTSSTGMCIRSGNSLVCSVKFRNIPADVNTTHKFLEKKYGVDRINQRKWAAQSFLRDAIGSISIIVSE